MTILKLRFIFYFVIHYGDQCCNIYRKNVIIHNIFSVFSVENKTVNKHDINFTSSLCSRRPGQGQKEEEGPWKPHLDSETN